MLLSSLLLIPIIGVFVILVNKDKGVSLTDIKFIALTTSILNLFISLIIFILFDFSTNQFQFVQEYHEITYFDFYLGIDGLSIYFVLLTTIIIPISLLSNWTSISKDVESYVIIILLLETLLLAVFLVLDILLFYIFFESILPPLFILIGIFGSDNRVKASFYLFLYTLLGSLFLLLSILAMSSIMSTTDFDTLFKGNFIYLTQLFLFYGIFIAFAVKTPTIFLNTWLLKAHVESPLGGSIILAAIVLKLSLYGILRLILPVLPKAYMEYTYIIYLIGVITIIYASLSTLRTIDVKELIAYSSVSHAAVYLLGVFSNSIQGIEGGINLGLAHGLVSPGLFICAGGILYDRSHTRLIAFYRGTAQIMPLFAILFFILCLANCGVPLSLNFIGEFLSLYGIFERSSLFGLFASSSIIFSAAYSIYMYQRISFGGAYSKMFIINIPDLNKREFMIMICLVIPTVIFGVYPAPILDGIHYSVSMLIYSFDSNTISCGAYGLLVFGRMSLDKESLSKYPSPHGFTSLPLHSSGMSIIEILALTIPVLLTVSFITIAERETMTSMQRRLGPNAVGWYGLLQAFADALKLLLKEYVSPTQANIFLFFLGPIITLIFSLLGYAFFEAGLNNIPVSIEIFRWIDAESLNVSWGFHFDALTVSMLISILIISLVYIYLIDYMNHNCQGILVFIILFVGTLYIVYTQSPILCHSPDASVEAFKQIAECKHSNGWSSITPTEFIRKKAALCDVMRPGSSYMGEPVYHQAYSYYLETYYKCKDCPAHLCGECNNLINKAIFLVISSHSLSTIISRLFICSSLFINKITNNIELILLFVLGIFTVILGVYIYLLDFSVIYCDSPQGWGIYFQHSSISYPTLFALLIWMLVFVMVFRYIDYVKNFCFKWGKLIVKILAGLPVMFVLWLFCNIACILYNSLPSIEDITLYYQFLRGDFELNIDCTGEDSHVTGIHSDTYLSTQSTGGGSTGQSTGSSSSPTHVHQFTQSVTINWQEIVRENIGNCDYGGNRNTPLAQNDPNRHIVAHLSSRTFYTCSVGNCHQVICSSCLSKP